MDKTTPPTIQGPPDTHDFRTQLRSFRDSFYRCLGRRADALFELADARLTVGSVPSPVHLSLSAAHRRGRNSLYAALGIPTGGGPEFRACLLGRPGGYQAREAGKRRQRRCGGTSEEIGWPSCGADARPDLRLRRRLRPREVAAKARRLQSSDPRQASLGPGILRGTRATHRKACGQTRSSIAQRMAAAGPGGNRARSRASCGQSRVSSPTHPAVHPIPPNCLFGVFSETSKLYSGSHND